jgi:hypothetical protein
MFLIDFLGTFSLAVLEFGSLLGIFTRSSLLSITSVQFLIYFLVFTLSINTCVLVQFYLFQLCFIFKALIIVNSTFQILNLKFLFFL